MAGPGGIVRMVLRRARTFAAAGLLVPVLVSCATGGNALPPEPTYSNDTTLEFAGACRTDDTVTVLVDDVAVASTTCAASAYSLTTPAIPIGYHTIDVDFFAPDSSPSSFPDPAAKVWLIDPTPASPPFFRTETSIGGGTETNPFRTDEITYLGFCPNGSIVTLHLDDIAVATAPCVYQAYRSPGIYIIPPVTPLADGPHEIRSTFTDGLGSVTALPYVRIFWVDIP